MSGRSILLSLAAAGLLATGCVSNTVGGEELDGAKGTEAAESACEIEERDCAMTDGAAGVQYCFDNEEGDAEWTECCVPDWENPCACLPPAEQSGEQCNTPLVLSFDGGAVEYTTEMAGSFDLTRVGMSVATDWPTAKTPWLALDRDDNGLIDDAGELFGSATRLSETAFAPNGFVALRALDANGDRVLDAEDPGFARLLLWSDADASRSSAASELTPAREKLVSIDLSYSADPRCDARGNCEVERAGFRYLDDAGRERTGEIVDIHLRTQLR